MDSIHLPQEIKDIIFDKAGIYTKYLNNNLDEDKLSEEQLDEILLEIFKNNKTEYLTMVEDIPSKSIKQHVTSPELYQLFIKHFPLIKKDNIKKTSITYFTISGIKDIWICVADVDVLYILYNISKLEHSVPLIYYCFKNKYISSDSTFYHPYVILQICKWISLEDIKSLINVCSDEIISDLINGSAAHGRFDIIHYFQTEYPHRFTNQTMVKAAEYGHLEMVKWLHINREEGCTTDAMNFAAKNGHLDVVKWLHFNREEGCTHWAIDKAAMNGHLEVVKFLLENRTEGYSVDAIKDAEKNNHFDIIKCLNENNNFIVQQTQQHINLYDHLMDIARGIKKMQNMNFFIYQNAC